MFKEILDRQILNKNSYKKGCNPCFNGISIKVEANKIIRVENGHGSFIHPVRKRQFLRLINNVLNFTTLKDCFININLTDTPLDGYFNFACVRNSPCQFLIPNHRFTEDDIQITSDINNTKNFDEEKTLIKSIETPYLDKINKIYTSSIPHKAKVDYFIYALTHEWCDGYAWVGSVHRNMALSPDYVRKLKASNLAGDVFVPFIKHSQYKYVLYNDGNTLSDRMRILLCLNSVIIMKKTPYEEFYTSKLNANVNYIEYDNINELQEIYTMLEHNPELCNLIIHNNNIFVNEILTYNNILQYTADIINAIC